MRIEKLKGEIIAKAAPGSYCCIILDNLLVGAEMRALELFDDLLEANYIVFLFLLTGELSLLNKALTNSRHDLHRFTTRDLTSRDALAFVKHRVELFREPKLPFLEDSPLFPFDEDDIREAVESGLIRADQNGVGLVTLRQLNVILSRILIRRLQELQANFNIATLSQDGIREHVLRLAEYYEKMVARWQG